MQNFLCLTFRKLVPTIIFGRFFFFSILVEVGNGLVYLISVKYWPCSMWFAQHENSWFAEQDFDVISSCLYLPAFVVASCYLFCSLWLLPQHYRSHTVAYAFFPVHGFSFDSIDVCFCCIKLIIKLLLQLVVADVCSNDKDSE